MDSKGVITMKKEIMITSLYFFIGGLVFIGLILLPSSLKSLYMSFIIGLIIGALIGGRVWV